VKHKIKNIILIHGIGGGNTTRPNFEWLKLECEKLGVRVFMPRMPGWKDNGTYEQWHKVFEQDCGKAINTDTIIFAQSLGTQFTVKYLAEKNKEIAGYISCAGMRCMKTLRRTPENEASAKNFENIIPSFEISKDEYTKFKALKFPKFSLYSDNDSYFEQTNLEAYIKEIGSQPVFVKGKGHFTIPDGVHKWSEALEIIKGLVGIE
jgi:predicted alpha/beta hydrolase family esterase